MNKLLLSVLSLSLLAAVPSWAQTDPEPVAPPTTETTVPPQTTVAPEKTVSPETPTATPAAPASNLEARKVLARSFAAYKALRVFHSRVMITDVQADTSRKMTGSFWYAAPGKARLDLKGSEKGFFRSFADGKNFFRQTNTKNYVTGPADDYPLEFVWERVPAVGSHFMISFFDGENIFEQPPFKDSKFTFTRVGNIDRITGSLAVGAKVSAQIQMDLDRNDHLFRSIEFSFAPSERTQTINTIEFSDVKVNSQVTPGTFVYKPSPGLKKISLEEAEATWDLRLKKGAQPFPIAATDLNGKPRSLAQYKGKVLLVDFWATWCGPCVEELPNVQRIYKKYHAKGFEVLGISLDNDKSQLTSFIKTKNVPWPQIVSGKIWRDPIVARYKVSAIPFTMLVGKDGKIIEVDLDSEDLEAAIKKALAAK